MKTKDLIAKLQKLIDEHEPLKEVMGEHEIMVDVFVKLPGIGISSDGINAFKYAGFSPNIIIEKSADVTYDIISSFASSQHENSIHR